MSGVLTAASIERDRPEQLPVSVADSSNLLTALVSAARDPSTDINKMERIFQMHKEICAIQAKSDFNDALARAQAKLEPARKNAKNTQTNSMYATFAAVMVVVMPAMTSEGLSLTFRPEPPHEPGNVRVVGILAKGGHEREYPLELPLDGAGIKGNANKTAVHATTSSGSYCQRILTKMIFGLSEDWEDKDGNLSTDRGGGNGFMSDASQDQIATLCAATSPDSLNAVLDHYKVNKLGEIPEAEVEGIKSRLRATKPMYGEAEFTKSFPAWEKFIRDRKKTAAEIISMVETKAVLSTDQKQSIKDIV